MRLRGSEIRPISDLYRHNLEKLYDLVGNRLLWRSLPFETLQLTTFGHGTRVIDRFTPPDDLTLHVPAPSCRAAASIAGWSGNTTPDIPGARSHRRSALRPRLDRADLDGIVGLHKSFALDGARLHYTDTSGVWLADPSRVHFTERAITETCPT